MKNKIIIYYDPDCGLCKKSCERIVKYLFLKNTDILPISSNPQANAIFLKEYSWVVYESDTGKYYSKSLAWWRLVNASSFSFLNVISLVPGVLWLGDRIYNKVARSRPVTCTV